MDCRLPTAPPSSCRSACGNTLLFIPVFGLTWLLPTLFALLSLTNPDVVHDNEIGAIVVGVAIPITCLLSAESSVSRDAIPFVLFDFVVALVLNLACILTHSDTAGRIGGLVFWAVYGVATRIYITLYALHDPQSGESE